MTTHLCSTCSTAFEMTPGQKWRLGQTGKAYCSQVCATAGRARATVARAEGPSSVPCTECAAVVSLDRQGRAQWKRRGRAYCSTTCRDAWVARDAARRMARTNRAHASERMRSRNPMRRPEVRERMAATLREIGHRPRRRGGNGSPMPAGQRALADLLGWPTEVIYATRTGARPWHYKLDIAHPAMKVCVEVDGGSHASRRDSDDRRDTLLRSRGWLVFRFSNRAAMERTEACAREVLSTTSKWRARTPTE